MEVRHEFTMSAVCPVDKRPDSYQVLIETDRVIPVEDILSAAAGFSDREIWQEHLTAEIADQLGVKVTTTGFHLGVKTTVVAWRKSKLP